MKAKEGRSTSPLISLRKKTSAALRYGFHNAATWRQAPLPQFSSPAWAEEPVRKANADEKAALLSAALLISLLEKEG
jgi:hypothetical protein